MAEMLAYENEIDASRGISQVILQKISQSTEN